MGESQGGERGLDKTPCSLANAQRVLWVQGGHLDGRRKKRKKRSDSHQVRKNERALKRRKENGQKRNRYLGRITPQAHILNYTPLHTPHPLVVWGCHLQWQGLPWTQEGD